jgi:hypothetical protein
VPNEGGACRSLLAAPGSHDQHWRALCTAGPVRSRTAWKVARALEQGAPTQLARLLKVA